MGTARARLPCNAGPPGGDEPSVNDAGEPIHSTVEEALSHSAWIHRLARRLAHGDAEADDLAQDTWLALLQASPSRIRRLPAWLAGAARGLASRRARGDARRRRRDASTARDGVDPSPLPSEWSARVEIHRRLLEHVEALGEPSRSAIYLRFLEELTPAEIARRLGVPAATVRSRIHRGLAELRDRLDRTTPGGRGAWLALVLPAPPGIAVAGGGSLLLPALLMKSTTLTALAVATALAAGAALWWAGPGGAPDPAISEVRGDAERREPATSGAPAPAVVAPSETRGRTETSAPPVATEAAAAAATARSFVEARLVDDARRPVARGWLRVQGGASGETEATGSGLAHVDLGVLDTRWPVLCVAGAPGFETRFVETVVAPGASAQLGDLVLGAGIQVTGRVVDPAGAPVAGASVVATAPISTSESMEQALRQGPPEASRSPRTQSGPDGTFSLSGVGIGFRTLWAHAPGFRHSPSDLLEVRAGADLAGIEVVLRRAPGADRIAGRVLDPDGNPVEGAQLGIVQRSTNIVWNASAVSDAHGFFDHPSTGPHPVRVRAEDAKGRWAPARAERSGESGEPLELRFAPARRFELRVKEPWGPPLEEFTVRALVDSDLGDETEWTVDAAAGSRGVVSLLEPAIPFRLVVEAPGHTLGRLGPFAPGAVPSPLECVLGHVPGIRGVVRARGVPVASARVTLWARVPADTVFEIDGFVSRVEIEHVSAADTNATGEFLVTSREHGDFVVRVDAEGFAPAERELLAFDPQQALEPLEIDLGPGGTIEGRILAADPALAAGRIVGIARYDGHPLSRRADAEGRFRFAGLLPGRWHVRLLDEELLPNSRSTRRSPLRGAALDLPWSCEVLEGEVTRHDIDLRDQMPCAVEGRLRLGGAPPGPWVATLSTLDPTPGLEELHVETTLDPEGRFVLRAPRPGRYRLRFDAVDGAGNETVLVATLELAAARTPWDVDLLVGALRVTNLRDRFAGKPRLVLRGEAAAGLRWVVWAPADAGDAVELPALPAGAVRALRAADDGAEAPLAEGRVEAGGTAELRLP